MANKPKLLQLLKMLPSLEDKLNQNYQVTRLPEDPAARQIFLAEQGPAFTGLVTSAAFGVSNDLVDALPNLKVISSFGVGLDKIDVRHADQKGIPVGYTPDVLNDCVADLAFGLMLGIGRRLGEGDQFVRSGHWASGSQGAFPLGFQVSHAKLGIVGLGRIGSTIAKRSVGFEMEVRYHSRNPVPTEPWTYEPSLIELATWADFLVVITSGGASTRHLINEDVLNALGPKGYLINVARGSVVDEAALLKALQDKRIAGAGLDVFENEPKVPPAFFDLTNVLMMPHVASATAQTRQAMGQRVVDNLEAFYAGRPMLSRAAG